MSLPTDPDERLEIGRRVHAKEFGSIRQSAEHYGVAQHAIYDVLREYRRAENIVTAQMQRAAETNRARIRTRHIRELEDRLAHRML